jgi:LDH2 family malate/lactate/ureidoglycolate dehydrogenase
VEVFADAEAHGKIGHGLVRISELESFPRLDPAARPVQLTDEPGYQRWSGNGALGYLTLAAICRAQIASPPDRVRLVVAADCFPTGALGHWVRLLAREGLVATLTATSPARLSHPDGGPPLTGTNPLAIGIPSSTGEPVVADVSMAKATWGDVLMGRASETDVVPFGGDQAHKAFALAVGLELLVHAFTGESHGALLFVARPDHDPVPAFRDLAAGVRLPGDR